MKIESVSASFPERIVTNDEIIEMVRQKSQNTFEGDLEEALNSIAHLLNYSGASEKRWLKPNEPFFPHIEQAANDALADANMTKSDIDMFIYASVDRRVLEPATSSIVAGALGFENIQCFDVMEACNSWSRATHIANAFLKTQTVRSVMVVTAEFNMHENDWSKNNYTLTKPEDINWAFATFTLGESATATILTEKIENEWQYEFVGKPLHADLCVFPLDKYAQDMASYNQFNINGVGPRKFVSHSKQLSKAAWQPLTNLIIENREKVEKAKIVFCHNHSEKYWLDMAAELSMDIPFYLTYGKYGNLVSGSIPGSIALALEEGKLQRNDPVFVIMGAAGVSCSAYSFIY